jgi:hypothetical protein
MGTFLLLGILGVSGVNFGCHGWVGGYWSTVAGGKDAASHPLVEQKMLWPTSEVPGRGTVPPVFWCVLLLPYSKPLLAIGSSQGSELICIDGKVLQSHGPHCARRVCGSCSLGR